MAVLVDPLEAHALVGALGGQVPEQVADLGALEALLAAHFEDLLEQPVNQRSAAELWTRRDPLDDPEPVGARIVE